MEHLNILSTWFLIFKTVFQLQLVASSSLIKKTPMIVDKSTLLCFFFFCVKQMEKSLAKRDTTWRNDTWAMSWEIKGPLRTKHHILSLPTPPPQSDQSTPLLMQSCDQVQKSLTLLTHHWMLKSQHPVSLIISTMYQPTRDQLVMTGPKAKVFFF